MNFSERFHMPAKKRAPTLKPSQLRHGLNVTQATSRHPERDCLAILMTHCAGLRVTELARLEIRDVVWPSGRLRDEMLLRAEITKNCKSRMVFLTVPKLRQSLESYLDFRSKNRLGCTLDTKEYRGLLPESKLLLTHRGGGFELVRKTRTLPDGRQEDYWAADAS
jgi:integrase/recombinase XerD